MFSKFSAIWRVMRGHRTRYIAAIMALVIASIFSYAALLIPKAVIDGVISSDPSQSSSLTAWVVDILGGREFLGTHLWFPAVLIALVTMLAGAFTYLRGLWSARASESIAREIRDRVYNHLQRLDARYFDKAETGDLLQRCTSDVDTVRIFLANQVVEIGRAVVMFFVPLPLMILIDWRMTIASVVVIPVIVAYGYFFFMKIKSVFKQADEAEGRLTTMIQENLTGIRVVRAFARQEFECEKLEVRNRDHRNKDYHLYEVMARFWALSDLMSVLQRAVAVGAGVIFLINGTLQVGSLFFFLSAVQLFIWPVRQLGRILTDLGKAMISLDRLNEILDEPEETAGDAAAIAQAAATLDESPAVPARPHLRGDLEFDNVVFSHLTGIPVLRGVSFTLPAGRSLGIMGQSGSGKSTIVNLLLRFYDCDSGVIRLDGRDIRQYDRQQVRSAMAVVMQEPFLYSKPIDENIRLARRDATEEEMVRATQTARIHDSILAFDEGYQTLVGERGVTLSGGQRQRVALSRALLHDPVLLILDDALSAVDTQTESMIMAALRQRTSRHSTIVIAHRLSTVMHADRIIVLDHGQVVQSGTHESLKEEPGLYRRLWRIQSTVEKSAEHGAETDHSGRGSGDMTAIESAAH